MSSVYDQESKGRGKRDVPDLSVSLGRHKHLATPFEFPQQHIELFCVIAHELIVGCRREVVVEVAWKGRRQYERWEG